MLNQKLLKELSEYLKKHNAPWLTDSQKDSHGNVPTLGGYASSRDEQPDRIALEAFLKNKKIFFHVLMDLKEISDKKIGKNQKFPEIYRKAFVSKQVFSSIFDGIVPAKDTVFKFAFALDASVKETEDLLRYAGYSFGDCVKRDLILKFCFEKKITDILDVNELLKRENEKPLLKDFKQLHNRKSKNLVIVE